MARAGSKKGSAHNKKKSAVNLPQASASVLNTPTRTTSHPATLPYTPINREPPDLSPIVSTGLDSVARQIRQDERARHQLTQFAKENENKNTGKNYAGAQKRYKEWCDDQGFSHTVNSRTYDVQYREQER
jgi:hypothetical protein